jgi:deazaflavin-dependent oxidoreductase (nitroreductase family)
MAENGKVYDSPKDWVASHIRSYTESDGRRGHRWHGVNTLLLTTRGRKSGKLRRTALIYGEDGKRYIVVASMGGAPRHPEWYLNLDADPEVRIQVGKEQFDAVATTATGAERSRYWSQIAEIWPDYNKYQKRTTRQIPVVLIEPR